MKNWMLKKGFTKNDNKFILISASLSLIAVLFLNGRITILSETASIIIGSILVVLGGMALSKVASRKFMILILALIALISAIVFIGPML